MKTPSQITENGIAARIAQLVTELVQFEAARLWTGFANKLPAKVPANAPVAAPVKRGRGRPAKAAKSNGSGQTVDAAVLNTIAATGRRGIRRDALTKMLAPSTRPNHIGRAVARHLKYERIVERDGRLYTTKAWVAKHGIPSRPQEETGATA